MHRSRSEATGFTAVSYQRGRREDHNNFAVSYLSGPLAATVAGKEEFGAPLTILMATSCTTRKDEVLNFISSLVSEPRRGNL